MPRILLVEPTAVIREPLCVVMQSNGSQVTAFGTAMEALALARASSPDLIVTEVALPDMDGIEFLRYLRSAPNLGRTPILVHTTVTDRAVLRAAVGCSISAYTLKQTFTLAGFMQRVHLALQAKAPALVAQPAPAAKAAAPVRAPAPAAPAPAPSPKPAANTPAPAPALADVGDDDDETQAAALARLRPIVADNEVDNGLNKGLELRALSPSIGHLMSVTSRANCSVEQVVEAVKMDHAVAVKILKLANSSVYTRGEPIDSIKKAVLRIGSVEIRQAVMNIAVVDRFSTPEMNKLLDCLQFWEHAIACGVIASELARHMGRRDADMAFTMGLLHDVGRMILAEQLGDRYVHVIRTALELGLPLDQVEKRMLRVNHADIMERVLRAWNFPAPLIRPIACHHLSAGNLRKAAPSDLAECGMIALANSLAQALMLGSSGSLTISHATDYVEMLGLDPGLIHRITENAGEQTNNIKFAMLSSSRLDAWPQMRETCRASLGRPFRPLYVSTDNGFDGVKTFVQHLASDQQDEPPNVGVIRLASPRDTVAATEAFIAAEAKAGVKMLPVVLISPTGKIALEESAMRGRAARLMTAPFAAPRFIDRVRSILPAAEAEPVAAAA